MSSCRRRFLPSFTEWKTVDVSDQDNWAGLVPHPPHDWFSNDQPIVLRLFPEYWDDSPLWPSSDDTDSLVSTDLLERLVRWNQHFNRHYSPDSGWSSQKARDQWSAESVELVAELHVELDGRVLLDVDLWPIAQSSKSQQLQDYEKWKANADEQWRRATGQGRELRSPLWGIFQPRQKAVEDDSHWDS